MSIQGKPPSPKREALPAACDGRHGELRAPRQRYARFGSTSRPAKSERTGRWRPWSRRPLQQSKPDVENTQMQKHREQTSDTQGRQLGCLEEAPENRTLPETNRGWVTDPPRTAITAAAMDGRGCAGRAHAIRGFARTGCDERLRGKAKRDEIAQRTQDDEHKPCPETSKTQPCSTLCRATVRTIGCESGTPARNTTHTGHMCTQRHPGATEKCHECRRTQDLSAGQAFKHWNRSGTYQPPKTAAAGTRAGRTPAAVPPSSASTFAHSRPDWTRWSQEWRSEHLSMQ